MSYLLAIDGSSLLTTCYYGSLPKEIMYAKTEEEKKLYYNKILQTEDGFYTNAIYGFLKTLFKIINNQKPTHVVIAFDKTRNTFRRKMYPEYKANRKQTPGPLHSQFILAEMILKNMGFFTLSDSDYEADDLIGSVTAKFENEIPIRILTKDQDYLQLITNNTRAWMVQVKQERADELIDIYYSPYGITKKECNLPDKVFEFTKSICLEEYGVRPSQIADLKGICGDASDNIPGVKGVSSAAVPLLKEYGTIERLYEEILSVEEKELNLFWKTQLGINRSPLNMLKKESAKEMALLSKKLATIKKDIPLLFVIDEMKLSIDKQCVISILKDYQMNSLIASIH